MSILDQIAKVFSVEESGDGRSHVPVATAALSPPVNLWEDDDSVYAESMLPGLKLHDMDILVSVADDKSLLTIKGARNDLKPTAIWDLRERGFGTFSRTVELPVPVETTQADAQFDDGVLTIRMAKCPQAKPKRIPVAIPETHSHAAQP